MNGRGTNNNQKYYKKYRLYKHPDKFGPSAEIGDELKGRGDGTFDNGELGHWECLVDEPIDDNGVSRKVSYP